MKKLLTVILCGAMALSMAACSQNPTAENSKPKSDMNASEESSSQPEISKADTDESAAPDLVFGKVTSITGNEIEISLAKSPYDYEQEKNESKADGDTGAEMDAVTMTEAMPAGEAGGEYTAPKLDLEYTGQNKTLTVPAGAKIIGTTGNAEKLTALKKGSVIMVMVDPKTNSVSEINIYE